MSKPITDPEEIRRRKARDCEACSVIWAALQKLDDVASSDSWMASEDIENLCDARQLLAEEICATYVIGTNRYVR